MNSKLTAYIPFLILAAVLFSFTTAKGESIPNDSLTLSGIINEVVQNHPMVKKAMEDITASDARIGLAKSANLPNVDFTSSYTRMGPISQITLPDVGSFSLMPHDNYSANFNVNQTISDFGRTEKSIQLEQQAKELSNQSVEQVKQKLSQLAIGNYYTLVYLQEAVKIKVEQLQTLNEHLRYIKKKQETGSATQYEILTTQVRISTIENQMTDLKTAIQIQVSQLNSLLGQPESTSHQVRQALNLVGPSAQSDSLMASALKNRTEMKLAQEKEKVAQLRFNLTNSQNNPVISAFASGGMKNGYIPYLYDPKLNFVAGIGLKIPILDGKRKSYNLVQAQSAIQVSNQETEIARRAIVDEVVEAEANLEASQKKVDQSQLQLQQAVQAYSLAKVRFESGVITNLELIEGSTAVSESRLSVLKSKIDYTVNIYKLKIAVGERLY
ncbi:MAG TPA: hypothetical protein DCL77_15045 [Prolixibacteraceae bacterium]|jgi:outer membrane protein TolC|nr:hypothetical protein [Prolixibacteraceae bacterium]